MTSERFTFIRTNNVQFEVGSQYTSGAVFFYFYCDFFFTKDIYGYVKGRYGYENNYVFSNMQKNKKN